MPKVSILTSYNKSISDIAILAGYNVNSKVLDAKYQYMISEVLMLRLFSILEFTMSEVALKLSCGASYQNGTNPIVLKSCKSVQDAHSNMLSYNRTKPLIYLQWTKASFVKESIKHVLDIRDKFYSNVAIYGSLINEMRIVRNHIAHRSNSTKKEYKTLLIRLYGGNPKLTVGAFLTSTNRNPLPNLDRYIASIRIILNDITKG